MRYNAFVRCALTVRLECRERNKERVCVCVSTRRTRRFRRVIRLGVHCRAQLLGAVHPRFPRHRRRRRRRTGRVDKKRPRARVCEISFKQKKKKRSREETAILAWPG